MKAFRVRGKFKMGRDPTSFSLEVIGKDEESSLDQVLSTLGSRHRVNRREIKISEVREITKGEATDPVVIHHLEKGA